MIFPFEQKLKFPIGFPAMPGSFGTHFLDGSPKGFCKDCKFYDGKSCGKAFNIAPIPQTSAACKLYKKRIKEKVEKKNTKGDRENEESAHGIKESSFGSLI